MKGDYHYKQSFISKKIPNPVHHPIYWKEIGLFLLGVVLTALSMRLVAGCPWLP